MYKNVTSNKTEHALVENKINELSEKVKALSPKGLTKDLARFKFSVFNLVKYFSSGII